MSILLNTAKDPNLIYDVGLHHGQDTDFYLNKAYRAVAFEANPGKAAFCLERFATEIADGRLTLVEGAVTEGSTADRTNGTSDSTLDSGLVRHACRAFECA